MHKAGMKRYPTISISTLFYFTPALGNFLLLRVIFGLSYVSALFELNFFDVVFYLVLISFPCIVRICIRKINISQPARWKKVIFRYIFNASCWEKILYIRNSILFPKIISLFLYYELFFQLFLRGSKHIVSSINWIYTQRMYLLQQYYK